MGNRDRAGLPAEPESDSAPKKPEISVVVAARNEERFIRSCLNALLEQDFPLTFEVIVVDNASTDRTAEIAATFPFRVIPEPEPNQLRAKHAGVAAALAEIVVILDADCSPHKAWLSSIYQALLSPGSSAIAAVTGCYLYEGLPWWGRVYNFLGKEVLVGFYRIFLHSMPFVVGGNVAFRRKDYVRFGGYSLAGGIAQTELGLAKRINKCGRIQYLSTMEIATSARRFQIGPIHFFFQYKLMDYFASYIRAA